MSSSSSSSWFSSTGFTVWSLLRWLLLLGIAILSWHALTDPDFFRAMTDRGMWSYMGRWIHRCIIDPPETPFDEHDQNVLFIGNSYTGYYELHKLTQAALVNGQQIQQEQSSDDNHGKNAVSTTWNDPAKKINVEAHFPGGQTFQGHWKGLTRPPYLGKHHVMHKWLVSNANIRHWKWIVLQNHSLQAGYYQSNDASNQQTYETSLQAVQEMAQIMHRHNPKAQFVFFMTWGRRHHYRGIPQEYKDFVTMQERTAKGYQRYVEATSTILQQPTYLAPVGLVFRTIYRDDQEKQKEGGGDDSYDPSRDPTSLFYQLLDYEGHHPALPGSYTAALTFYATLTGKDPTKLTWKPKGVSQEHAVRIRNAVHRTIQETAQQGTIRYPWQEQ